MLLVSSLVFGPDFCVCVCVFIVVACNYMVCRIVELHLSQQIKQFSKRNSPPTFAIDEGKAILDPENRHGQCHETDL